LKTAGAGKMNFDLNAVDDLLCHPDFNNTRHASPLDAHLGGFFCMK
jgi:hypothetical protein